MAQSRYGILKSRTFSTAATWISTKHLHLDTYPQCLSLAFGRCSISRNTCTPQFLTDAAQFLQHSCCPSVQLCVACAHPSYYINHKVLIISQFKWLSTTWLFIAKKNYKCSIIYTEPRGPFCMVTLLTDLKIYLAPPPPHTLTPPSTPLSCYWCCW